MAEAKKDWARFGGIPLLENWKTAVNDLYDGKPVDEWLYARSQDSFPGRADYPSRLKALRDHLQREFYPHIEAGSVWNDQSAGTDGAGFLTDHGVAHVDQVIARASALLHLADREISPYEMYLLLVAVSLHDVGNILGRRSHETSGFDAAFRTIGTLAGIDLLERRIIRDVVTAHGGKAQDGGKDTIGKLPETETLLSQRVRVRLLAGILRFADELAEDRTRASRFLLATTNLEGSEIYHAYANSLASVEIEPDLVFLNFEMTREEALRRYRKGVDEVYLLDEIFLRTIKMHRERIYCMRFLRSMLAIDRIRVRVRVYDRLELDYVPGPPLEDIYYTLEESGYPEAVSDTIRDLCPDLGTESGQALAARLSSGGRS